MLLLFVKLQCVRCQFVATYCINAVSFRAYVCVCVCVHAGARSAEKELKASSIINVMALRVGSNVPSLPMVY